MMLGSGLVTGCLSLGSMARGKFPGLSDWRTCLSFRPSFFLPTFSYIGDCEISAELQKIQAGVNGIQVCGTWWHCPPPFPRFLPLGREAGQGEAGSHWSRQQGRGGHHTGADHPKTPGLRSHGWKEATGLYQPSAWPCGPTPASVRVPLRGAGRETFYLWSDAEPVLRN